MKSVHFISGLIFVGAISIILTKNNIYKINRYLSNDIKPYRTIHFNDGAFFELREDPFKKSTLYTNKSFGVNNDRDIFNKEILKIAQGINDVDYIRKVSLFYHYGFRCADNEVKGYVKNNDIIHIGPRCGEAVYVLKNYTNGKIICINNVYSDTENFDRFILKNKLNKIPYTYEKINLTGENCTINFNTVGISGELKYEACKLDDYMSKSNGKIGGIVISGSVLDHPLFPLHLHSNARHEDPLINLLRGSLETIKKHRPVLSMPYYYSGEFLQEIENFVTENLPDYKFIKYWQRFTDSSGTPFGEVILFGYPQELSNSKMGEN